MSGFISSSIMCADLGRLEKTLRSHEEAGIDYIHVDIMDGDFVPNFTFGPDFVKTLRRLTAIPLDIHLMVNRPERFIDMWGVRKGDIVTLHQESTNHLQRALAAFRSRDAKTGVAINPATPVNSIEEVLDDMDVALVMTVNPGFAGQTVLPQAFEKIRRMRSFLDEKGYRNVQIEVDGNVACENAKTMREKGADIFVVGTSSIFRGDLPFFDAVKKMRDSIR